MQHTDTQVAEFTGTLESTADHNSLQSMIFDDEAFKNVEKIATVMANSRITVPQHLQKNVGDCMAIVMQAIQWGMNPWPVAQKTHVVSGNLGYEAQLVNAVITSMAPTKDRINYEWFGEWEKVIGNFVEKTSSKGHKFMAPNWNLNDEKGLGIRIWATMKGEDEPRVLELLLSQAQPRNSTLWASDPKQQLAYLATKRWARLYCPDVILGVYTPDEYHDQPKERDITPRASATVKPASRTAGLKGKLKNSKAKAEPADDIATEQAAGSPADLWASISAGIDSAKTDQELTKAITNVEQLDDAHKAKARFAFKLRQCELKGLPVSVETSDGETHIINSETGEVIY